MPAALLRFFFYSKKAPEKSQIYIGFLHFTIHFHFSGISFYFSRELYLVGDNFKGISGGLHFAELTEIHHIREIKSLQKLISLK